METELVNSILELKKDQKAQPSDKYKNENNYKFFEGTVNNNNNNFNLSYISFILGKDSINGKIFLDYNKKEKYIEIFHNRKMDVLGISPNITFIHQYSINEKDHYNPSKFIGFRYYENGPLKEGKFFTLIKINNYKYFILEKNKLIKDINNKLFYDENLDCLKIIKKIIYDKHKTSLIGSNGDLFPELIGFCYALCASEKIKNFIFVEPLISDINVKDCLKDNIPEIIEDNNIYIEPFIFDGHVSLILSVNVKFKENRYNIILDMSSYHFENEVPNFFFLPKSLTIRNVIYPKSSIQAYSSCCLWFYGEIECLLTMEKYSSFESILDNLRENRLDFYIDVINFLSKEFEGIECLIKKEKEQYTENNPNIIDLNRLCLTDGEKYYSVDKDIIYSKFLDVNKFLNDLGNLSKLEDIIFLSKCQKYIMNYSELKNKLLFNLKYYNFLPQSVVISEGKKILSNSLMKIDKLIALMKRNYVNIFYFNNISSLEDETEDLLDKISKPFKFSPKRKTKIFNSGSSDLFFGIVSSYYSNFEKDIKKKIRLLSEETILNEIKILNDICFSIMNK